jgi:Mrp family chromosome partitioning ATPase
LIAFSVSFAALYAFLVVRELVRHNGRYQISRLAQLLNVPFLRLPARINNQTRLLQFQKSVELFAMKLRKQKAQFNYETVAVLNGSNSTNDMLFLQGLAVSLSKVGDKVLILDLDLHRQMMKYELARQLDFSDSKSLADIEEISASRKTPAALLNALSSNFYSLTPDENVQFFDFAGTPEDLFSFFHSKAFVSVIDVIKKQDYDWILCKTPVLTTDADAFSILSFADASIMLTSKKASLNSISSAIEQVYDLENSVVGILSDEGVA